MKRYLLGMLCAFGIAGCADHVVEPEGTSIEVVPIHYQFNAQSQDHTLVEQRFEAFVQRYQLEGSTAQWQIIVNGSLPQPLVSVLDEVLANNHIALSQVEHQVNNTSNRFSVSVIATDMQVRLEVCQQQKVGHYGYSKLGCYTDGNRWQSMVNPEKSL